MAFLLGMEDEPIGKDEERLIDFKVNKVGGKPVILKKKCFLRFMLVTVSGLSRIGQVGIIQILCVNCVISRCCLLFKFMHLLMNL